MPGNKMTSVDAFSLATWAERGGVYIRRLMRDAILTDIQAAGLVGNLGFKSIKFTVLQEVRPTVPGSRGGYGVAQWTGSRRVAFENWCATNMLAPASDEANYGFLLYELEGTHKSFASKLRNCRKIEDACLITHRLYEIPSDVIDGSYRSQPARLALAKEALAGALAAAPDPTPEPPEPAVATLADTAAQFLAHLRDISSSTTTIPEDLKMTFRRIADFIAAILHPAGPKPAPMDPKDFLDDLSSKHPSLNVRTSLIDLMRALGYAETDMTLAERRELAKALGIEGNVGEADTNAAMHRALAAAVAANGGKVPDELL